MGPGNYNNQDSILIRVPITRGHGETAETIIIRGENEK